jgi:hypothetical protein
MDTQPKALQFADEIFKEFPYYKKGHQWSAELRRLHSVNAELLDVLSKYITAGVGNSTDFAIQREAFFLAKDAIAKAQKKGQP